MNIFDRFFAKVDMLDNGCWEWTASRGNGYGRFSVGGAKDRRLWPAHRWSYEYFVGAVPEGLELDHLCRNRACVNPEHLEPVTSQENSRRGNAGINMASKTHCPQGHPYDAENTYNHPKGWRRCKICQRRCSREWQANKRRTLREAGFSSNGLPLRVRP